MNLPQAEVVAELTCWKSVVDDVNWVLEQWLKHCTAIAPPQVKDKRPVTRAALLEQEKPRKCARK